MGIHEYTDYANWISLQRPRTLALRSAVLFLLAFASFPLLPSHIVSTLVRVLLFIGAFYFLQDCCRLFYWRWLLSYQGGGIQGRILDSLLAYLPWDGEGTLLDIGCGSGALSIKAAQKFPLAHITGVDLWGADWDYGREQCERNAWSEGVPGRVVFMEADAAALPFADGSFSAVVSNLVFHEVPGNKLAIMREALRVLQPGGFFVFQDIFHSHRHYPDYDGLLTALRSETGELHFVDTRNSSSIPSVLKNPMVAGNMALIWGRK